MLVHRLPSVAGICTITVAIGLVISPTLAGNPQFTGGSPPWRYRGFEKFPALFFGANISGLENEQQMDFVAKHQVAGWGHQQYQVVSPDADDDQHYYAEETYLAQQATRLATYMELSKHPPQTQAIFVYRHAQLALSWYTLSRAAYLNKENDAFWVKNSTGGVCICKDRGGPTWNFSNPMAANFFVDEIIGELTREANIQSVFFDETDQEYCGGDLCGLHLSPAEWARLYRDKIKVLRRTAIKLNAAGIWPMYSSINGFGHVTFGSGKCSVGYEEYYGALHDVGWFRFYEYFDAHMLPNYLAETTLGLPVVVHHPQSGDITLALAAFLIGQGKYTYFSTSIGWTDPEWSWHAEYDRQYGTPLAPAIQNTSGWYREFTGCTVHVAPDLKSASIIMKAQQDLVVSNQSLLQPVNCTSRT